MSTACDVVGAALTIQDVFGVSDADLTLDTPLESECDDVKNAADRFNQYCLIPTNLPFGTTCDPSTLASNPSFIFTLLATGQLTTLEQLPLLWSSAPAAVGSNEEYIYIPPALSSPPLTQPFDGSVGYFPSGMMITPSAGCSVLMGIYRKDSKAYMTSNDGLYHAIEVAPKDSHRGVSISANANLRVVGTLKAYFFWTTDDQVFREGPEQKGSTIINIKAWNNTGGDLYLAVMSRNLGSTVTTFFVRLYKNQFDEGEIASFEITSGTVLFDSFSGAFALSDDNADLFVCTTRNVSAGTRLEVRIISLTSLATPTALGAYQFGISYFLGRNFFSSATTRGIVGVSSSYRILWSPGNGQFVDTTFPADGSTVVLNSLGENADNYPVTASQDNVYQTYAHGSALGYTLVLKIGATEYDMTPEFQLKTVNGIPFDPFASYGVDPSGEFQVIAWGGQPAVDAQSKPRLYFTTASSTTPASFLNNVSTIWMSVGVSDTGKAGLDTDQFNPGPQWFMGTYENHSSSTPIVSLPQGATFNSLHNKYQVRTTVEVGAATSIPSDLPQIYDDTAILYRVNEVKFINTPNYETRLFSDGNLRVVDTLNNDVMVWENFMHDGFNSKVSFNVVSLTRPTVSPNGVYLTYWPSNGTFRECYYPFNSERLRDYGKTSDSIFANSLLAQRNFCFENLQDDPTDPFNSSFADDRCACIGGERLFNSVFENTELLPSGQRGLMLTNLPCMMIACSKSRQLPEATNTYRDLENKCKLPIVICTNVIRASEEAAVNNIIIDQTCGGALQNSCKADSDCAFGSVCRGNQCVVSCAEASDCRIGGSVVYECRNSVCVAAGDVPSDGLSTSAIAGIVVGLVVAIILIAVLSWYFTTHKTVKK